MKVVERATMPDGTKILLEDWSDKNTEQFPDLYGLQIGAYPIRKGYCKWFGWFGKPAERFRLTISQNKYTSYSNNDVREDFEALKNGIKSLEDLAAHFWDGEKDMWYLGMDVEYKGW